MSNITLKRSLATMAVMAGALAAAGPASAGTQVGSEGVKAPTGAVVVLIGANDHGSATPQGFIMSDGRICNPRWGC